MRITGGVHRSRGLVAPRGTATRPTSDRVREALFNMLASRGVLQGARVLDLYAGTGALALEALSRGAAAAVLVESARDALTAIRTNVEALGCGPEVEVIALPVERAIQRMDGKAVPFDLVMLDPPYVEVPSGAAARALASLLQAGLVASEATLVLEHAAGDAPPAVIGLDCEQTRRHGDTSLSFYLRALAR